MMLKIGNLTFLIVLHPVSLSESAVENVYQTENGHSIIYPIRKRQKNLTLSVEVDSAALEKLLSALAEAEIPVAGCGIFRKTSEINVETVSENVVMPHSYLMIDGITQETAKGCYIVSVSLEEV